MQDTPARWRPASCCCLRLLPSSAFHRSTLFYSLLALDLFFSPPFPFQTFLPFLSFLSTQATTRRNGKGLIAQSCAAPVRVSFQSYSSVAHPLLPNGPATSSSSSSSSKQPSGSRDTEYPASAPVCHRARRS